LSFGIFQLSGIPVIGDGIDLNRHFAKTFNFERQTFGYPFGVCFNGGICVCLRKNLVPSPNVRDVNGRRVFFNDKVEVGFLGFLGRDKTARDCVGIYCQ
jgi:hypothetical protein